MCAFAPVIPFCCLIWFYQRWEFSPCVRKISKSWIFKPDYSIAAPRSSPDLIPTEGCVSASHSLARHGRLFLENTYSLIYTHTQRRTHMFTRTHTSCPYLCPHLTFQQLLFRFGCLESSGKFGLFRLWVKTCTRAIPNVLRRVASLFDIVKLTGLTFASTQWPMLEFIFPRETVIHKLSELCNVIASEIILSHNLHYGSKGQKVMWSWVLPLFW